MTAKLEQKHKYEGDYESIVSFGKEIIKTFTGKEKTEVIWENDFTFKITEDGKDLGKVILNRDMESDQFIEVEGETLVSELKRLEKKKQEAERNKVTKPKIKDTTLRYLFDKKRSYNGLEKNYKLFKKLDDKFSELGFKYVKVDDTIRLSNTATNNLELFIRPHITELYTDMEDGYGERLKNVLFDILKHEFKDKRHWRIDTPHFIRPLDDETVKELKIANMVVGHYFVDRNLVTLYYNPFELVKFTELAEELPVHFESLFEVLESLDLTQKNTSSIKDKILIQQFINQARGRLQQVEASMKSLEKRIAERERAILTDFKSLKEYKDEQTYLKSSISATRDRFVDELEKTRKLSFIDKVDVNVSGIKFTFKETTIPLPNFSRDRGKIHGKRYVYGGQITIKINPSTFGVSNTISYRDHPHPHVGTDGSPCFGQGDGRDKIYQLLANHRFSDLAKMLWFWIKTFVDGTGFLDMATVYDYSLRCGYPVFDEKGNRIEINDEARIKTGEQIELDKLPAYNANVERYKDFTMEG